MPPASEYASSLKGRRGSSTRYVHGAAGDDSVILLRQRCLMDVKRQVSRQAVVCGAVAPPRAGCTKWRWLVMRSRMSVAGESAVSQPAMFAGGQNHHVRPERLRSTAGICPALPVQTSAEYAMKQRVHAVCSSAVEYRGGVAAASGGAGGMPVAVPQRKAECAFYQQPRHVLWCAPG